MPTFLELSWKTILKIFLFVLAVGAIYFFRDLIAIFLSSIVIATVVEGPVMFLIKKGLPRFLAVTVIYLGALGLLSLLVYFMVPAVIDEFAGASEALLNIFNRMLRSNIIVADILLYIQQNIGESIRGIGQGAGAAFQFVSRIVGGFLTIILVFVVSFYLAVQGRTIERLINLFAPEEHQNYLRSLWTRSQRKIGRWFYGQIILSVFVGLPVFFGLWMLGVNYALLIAILAALFEIVPVVGPIIPGVIATLIAAQQGLDLALYAIVLFVLIQQVENQIFVPTVMQRSIGLNPVVVLFALLIGSKIAGLWGVILAVPVTAALSELAEDWEHKKIFKSSEP